MHGVDTADNLFDYFALRVDEARSDRGVALTDDVRFYLIQLLSDRARTDRDGPHAHTLAELHAAACTARPGEAARTWRELGDRALYALGWFREQLDGRMVGPRYYEDMGTAAYARTHRVMERWFSQAFGSLFADLAQGFHDCVDVLGGVRALHEEDDLDTWWDRWLVDRDPEAARRLRRAGLVLPRTTDEDLPGA